jgi:hypothetical protein
MRFNMGSIEQSTSELKYSLELLAFTIFVIHSSGLISVFCSIRISVIILPVSPPGFKWNEEMLPELCLVLEIASSNILLQTKYPASRRFWRILTMMYHAQNYWVSGLSSSGIVGIRKHDVSETWYLSEMSCFLVHRIPDDAKIHKPSNSET